MYHKVPIQNNYRFVDLIDLPSFARMLENFQKATGIPNSIVDPFGVPLSQAGWTDACTRFHGTYPVAKDHCSLSNRTLIQKTLKESSIACEYCSHGLMEYAIPIMIEGQQLATLIMGQVLHSPPDMKFFRSLAHKYGYHETEYLKAIQDIPIIEEDKIHSCMQVIVNMVDMLARSGLERLQRSEIHQKADFQETLLRAINEVGMQLMVIEEGRIDYISNLPLAYKLGYTDEIIARRPLLSEIIHRDDRAQFMEMYNRQVAGENVHARYDLDLVTRDGEIRSFETSVFVIPGSNPVRVISVGSDITERKELEQELQIREREFRTLAENLPSVIVRYDRECRRTYVNPAYVRETENLADFAIGKVPSNDWRAENVSVSEYVSQLQHVMESGVPTQMEIQWMNHKTEKIVYYDLRVVPDFGPDGTILGVLVIGHNISTLKATEALLKAKEQEFRSLAESSPDAIIRYDMEQRIVYMNDRLVKDLPISSPGEVIGRKPTEIWPDGRFTPIEEGARRAIKSGEAREVELHWKSIESQYRIEQIIVIPEWDVNGNIIGTIAFGRDVSEIRNAEQRIKHIIEAIPGLVFSFRLSREGEGSFPYVSPAITELFGLKAEDVSHDMAPIRNLVHPIDRPIINGAIEESAKTLKPFLAELRICRPGMSEKWVEVRSIPSPPERDGSILWHGIVLDITERKNTRQRLEVLDFAINLTSDAVFLINEDLMFEYVNRQACLSLGYSEEELLSMSISDIDQDMARETLLEMSKQNPRGQTIHFETRHRSKNGTIFPVEIAGTHFKRNGKMFVISIVRNITKRKRMEEDLATREQEFRTLAENTPDTIARYDPNLRRIYTNPAFASLIEGENTAHPGKNPTEVPGGNDSINYQKKLKDVFLTGKGTEFELNWPLKDGTTVYSLIKLTPEYDPEGNISSVLAVGRDISELITYRNKIHQMAFYDSITGLSNRALFLDRSHQLIVDARRHGQKLGVMILDLDRFKIVNDTLGHSAGDRLLHEVGERLIKCVRTCDTVARMGGDEFAVLLPVIQREDDLKKIATRILQSISNPFVVEGKEFFITTSIGISIYPDDSTNQDDLIKQADSAMYHAKHSGRNKFGFYSIELITDARERLTLEGELRRSFIQEELDLYFQPQVDLKNGSIIGSEALLRWEHPERGFISPDVFIKIAEDSSLILEIGEWVIIEGCKVASIWNRYDRTDHRVAINLSSRQFQSGDITSVIQNALHVTGCKPEWIELEITESLLLEDNKKTLKALRTIREMGISIAIDDFGTGYSALGYLSRFPVDTLKIDRSFVGHIPGKGKQAEIVRAIISIGHSLNMRVIAEGVETSFQSNFLKEQGCHIAQGYFYGKPVPGPAIEALLLGEVR